MATFAFGLGAAFCSTAAFFSAAGRAATAVGARKTWMNRIWSIAM
jgi:hypothetical protein